MPEELVRIPRRRRRSVEAEVEVEVEVEEAEVQVEEKPTRRRRRKAAPTPPPAEEEFEHDVEEAPKPAPKKKRANKSKSTEVATTAPGQFAGMEGEVDADDFEMPGFKLLHPMSPDAEETPEFVGHFVYDKEIDLGENVDIIIARFRKRWREDCAYDENVMPQEFDSKKEAISAGVKVLPVATIDLLIPCTEETEDDSLIDLDGEPYLMCRWFLGGSGYRKVASPLMKHRQRGVDGAVWDRFFTLSVVKLPGKGRRKVASLKPTEDLTSAAIRADIALAAGAIDQ